MPTSKENVFVIDYHGISCNNQIEACKIADRIAQKVRRLHRGDAIFIIVLSNIDSRLARVSVNSQGHKTIVPLSVCQYDKSWHVHISYLGRPGSAISDEMTRYLAKNYPSNSIVWKKRDPFGVGYYTYNRIPYILAQSVVLRTVVIGDVTKLYMAPDFLNLVFNSARKIGYQNLKIFSVHM